MEARCRGRWWRRVMLCLWIAVPAAPLLLGSNPLINIRSASTSAKSQQVTRMQIQPEGGASPCNIKVIGVGGGGSNAVKRMMESEIEGVEFWSLNTDVQALGRVYGARTMTIGNTITRGLGAGGVPDIGRRAADESRQQIADIASGTDLVFVTAGMGGGTGSGAAPVVAEVAKEAGALTVGVVTKPFSFEGRRRMAAANQAIAELEQAVDTLIVVNNDQLLKIIPTDTPVELAFKVADDVLRQGVVGISDIIVKPGLINVDFADVRSVMGGAGTAMMGIGRGSGKNRAEESAQSAISSALLDVPITGAQGIVFNVLGGKDMSLQEINSAAEVIYSNVDPNANIIFGALVDESMGDNMAVTVIATGFGSGRSSQGVRPEAQNIQRKEQQQFGLNSPAVQSYEQQRWQDNQPRTASALGSGREPVTTKAARGPAPVRPATFPRNADSRATSASQRAAWAPRDYSEMSPPAPAPSAQQSDIPAEYWTQQYPDATGYSSGYQSPPGNVSNNRSGYPQENSNISPDWRTRGGAPAAGNDYAGQGVKYGAQRGDPGMPQRREGWTPYNDGNRDYPPRPNDYSGYYQGPPPPMAPQTQGSGNGSWLGALFRRLTGRRRRPPM